MISLSKCSLKISFREDNDLHEMHTAWHQLNGIPEYLPTNRQRERFFTFHNIMILR